MTDPEGAMEEVQRYAVKDHELIEIPKGGVLAPTDDMTEVVFSRAYDALQAKMDRLEKESDDNFQGYEEVKALLQAKLAEAEQKIIDDVTDHEMQINTLVRERETNRDRITALEAALRSIAEHPHCAYNDGANDSYMIGVVDGHRCASNIATQALATGGETPKSSSSPCGHL